MYYRESMLRGLGAAAGLCALLATALPARAATGPSASFPAVRADKPPALDPALSDPVWQQATAVTGLETITTQKPSPHESRFLLLYDDANLYVGMRLEQRVPLTASQSANNVGFGLDDFAGIGIDPSGSGAQVYFFMTTPRGTRYQQALESARYAPPWSAVAARDASGWSAMLVIPLAALRTGGQPVQNWRFNFIRRVAAQNVNESWAYDPTMTDGGGGTGSFPQFNDARFWPRLTGLALKGTRAVRRAPRAELYALAGGGADRHRFQTADGSFAETGTRGLGADVAVPLTGTASFVGAFAPDFSNVEADQQTIAPQEFRRALNEYRPFFAQGAAFFDPLALNRIDGAPDRIFYSPSIGEFDRGLKVEGTAGLQSFGALEAKGAGFDDAVFGLKHSTPGRTFQWSLDGALAHHADGNATFDPRAGNDAAWEAQVQGRNLATGLTYTTDYAAERGTFASGSRLAYKSEDYVDLNRGNYEVYLGYRTIGPQYAPLIGYTSNADLRGPMAFFDLNGTLSPHGPLKRADLFLSADRATDGSGAVHQADFTAALDLQLQNGLHLSGGPFASELRTYDGGLIGYPFYAGGVTRAYNQHSVALGWKEGTPAPLTAQYSWGPFADTYVQQVALATSRPLGARWSIGAELDGTVEHPSFGGPRDGQWLRRVNLGATIDANTNLSVSLRSVSGTGGFAQPGLNLAGSFHRRFKNDSELFVNYGTPASPVTLQRFIVKYVLRAGGSGAGT